MIISILILFPVDVLLENLFVIIIMSTPNYLRDYLLDLRTNESLYSNILYERTVPQDNVSG